MPSLFIFLKPLPDTVKFRGARDLAVFGCVKTHNPVYFYLYPIDPHHCLHLRLCGHVLPDPVLPRHLR